MQQKFESEILKTQIEVQEQTMQTIAADLHDNIGQLLSLTTVTLSSVNLEDQNKASQKIANSLELVNTSIKELRQLARLLHGEHLIKNGLGDAIKQETDRLERLGNFKLKVNNHLTEEDYLCPDKDLIILRLLQEIVNNIIKHAQASEIEISCYVDAGKLTLRVVDNGKGFIFSSDVQKGGGLGLHNLQKRTKMLGGTIRITSEIEKGTKVLIEIPYP